MLNIKFSVTMFWYFILCFVCHKDLKQMNKLIIPNKVKQTFQIFTLKRFPAKFKYGKLVYIFNHI